MTRIMSTLDAQAVPGKHTGTQGMLKDMVDASEIGLGSVKLS